MRQYTPERNQKISAALKAKYNGSLPAHQLAALREAHRTPEARENHRQATLRQFAAIKDHSPMHTPIEKRLVEGMQAAGLSFATQQMLLGKYIVDFLMIGKSLVIEADGLHHRLPRSQAKDRVRDAALNQAGYTVLRFPGFQINRYLTECVATIQKTLDTLDGELPKTQTVIIGNQNGPNNPAFGKPAWNKGLKAETDERQRNSSKNSYRARMANGFSDKMKKHWQAYRDQFDWTQMKADYLAVRSVSRVAAMHHIGKRQLREYLIAEGVTLDGHLHNKGRSGRPHKVLSR